MPGALWGAALILLVVFGGIIGVIWAVSLSILVGTGKWTIPGTQEHRLRKAQVDAAAAELQAQIMLAQEQMEVINERRYDKALGPGRGHDD